MTIITSQAKVLPPRNSSLSALQSFLSHQAKIRWHLSIQGPQRQVFLCLNIMNVDSLALLSVCRLGGSWHPMDLQEGGGGCRAGQGAPVRVPGAWSYPGSHPSDVGPGWESVQVEHSLAPAVDGQCNAQNPNDVHDHPCLCLGAKAGKMGG